MKDNNRFESVFSHNFFKIGLFTCGYSPKIIKEIEIPHYFDRAGIGQLGLHPLEFYVWVD